MFWHNIRDAQITRSDADRAAGGVSHILLSQFQGSGTGLSRSRGCFARCAGNGARSRATRVNLRAQKSLQALFVLQTFLISLMRDPVLTFYAHNTTHA